MKIIDLLNKIANGKIPNKIKFDDMIWEYDGDYYVTKNNLILEEYCNLTTSLNDEVEILEEKKIPEKLDQTLNLIDVEEKGYYRCIMENIFKINEIIDYLKSKGE